MLFLALQFQCSTCTVIELVLVDGAVLELFTVDERADD